MRVVRHRTDTRIGSVLPGRITGTAIVPSRPLKPHLPAYGAMHLRCSAFYGKPLGRGHRPEFHAELHFLTRAIRDATCTSNASALRLTGPVVVFPQHSAASWPMKYASALTVRKNLDTVRADHVPNPLLVCTNIRVLRNAKAKANLELRRAMRRGSRG